MHCRGIGLTAGLPHEAHAHATACHAWPPCLSSQVLYTLLFQVAKGTKDSAFLPSKLRYRWNRQVGVLNCPPHPCMASAHRLKAWLWSVVLWQVENWEYGAGLDYRLEG